MRAPEELNEVDWAALEHAYGPAGGVPEMIRVLYAQESPETERGENVGEELINNLNHQGSLYPATLAAVPFLAHLALHVTWHREALLEVLTGLAELGEWGVPAPESLGGRVRAAVLAELPLLMGCLTDPDPYVRQAAIRLACVGTRPADPAVLRTLADLYESDPSALTRADALTALALLDPDPSTVRAREAAAIDDRDREVRLAAALSGLDRAEPPYPAGLVAVVAADGAALPGSHRFTARPRPFPYPGAPHDRENELLTEDPEGALSVARAWIAAGDTHRWGSRLAGQVDQRWRDREAQCVAALAEALPLHQDGAERSSIVRAIAGLTPRAGDPGSHLRDLLLAEAAGDEQDYAAGSQYAPGVAGRESRHGTGRGLLWVDVEGLGEASVVGQTVHAAALAEPAEHQHRLPERAQCPGSSRRADPPAVGGQQAGDELDAVVRDVERGNIGDQREASGSADDLVSETCPTRGFASVHGPSPAPRNRNTLLRGDRVRKVRGGPLSRLRCPVLWQPTHDKAARPPAPLARFARPDPHLLGR
ncbi:HEAT repeat-containing protein [Streptomyces sp. OK228]|nr:HEAT repeat-containing protein [Streptomyces sp. OK228]